MPKHAITGTTVDASWLTPQEQRDWAAYLTRTGNPSYVNENYDQMIILGTRDSLRDLLQDEFGLDAEMAADHLRRERVVVGVGIPAAYAYAPRHRAHVDLLADLRAAGHNVEQWADDPDLLRAYARAVEFPA